VARPAKPFGAQTMRLAKEAAKALRSRRAGQARPLQRGLGLVAVGVEEFERAEEGGLVFDLGAVADEYDLHVG